MDVNASWIRPKTDMGDVCPVFRRRIAVNKPVKQAVLNITALGVYEARMNGNRIGEFILAPGWTSYQKRLQVQEYKVTDMICAAINELTIVVGKGWFRSPMPGWMESKDKIRRKNQSGGLIALLRIEYIDGSTEEISSDESWECGESRVRFSEIYDGEIYDACFKTHEWKPVEEFTWPKEILIPQEGEEIREICRVQAKSVLTTPAGETVVDFGQEVTGYTEISLTAHQGERVRILHGEVLDRNGNFYHANYRSAKAELLYICKDGRQSWHPQLTFFGFRYLKVEEFPGVVDINTFTAVAVCSDIKQTGTILCGNAEWNQLFSNIIWGQKGNFLDVPTDCPQRDERLGWTGDAQVFIKAACYNFDSERFFVKWLHDLEADQRKGGAVGQVIPDYLPELNASAAWGDAAVICPWQIYQTYGNVKVLHEQFESMKNWVDYITNSTTTKYLWTGGEHFGDWLGLDAPSGSYKGSSREDFIASAFYAYSTGLLIKAGEVIKKEMKDYRLLYQNIIHTFQKTYPKYYTQTEHILAVWFDLATDLQQTADDLAVMIEKDGCQMRTGFVGTPYILHVLSKYGHSDLAYTLLLRKAYPSWLYAVEKGATTIWEHWDGIMENGEFWSADMNSFNHYAYGAVADWIYERAAGITHAETEAGFTKVRIAPCPDKRLGWLEVSIKTRNGLVSSAWKYTKEGIRYHISVDMPAIINIAGKETAVQPGVYVFWEK